MAVMAGIAAVKRQIRLCVVNVSICQREGPLFSGQTNVISSNSYSTKAEKKRGVDRKPTPKVEHTWQSLASKGFLRPTQDYSPPSDYKAIIQTLCAKHFKTHDDSTLLGEKKAAILTEAGTTFNFAVPNSLLHQILSVSDLTSFYGQETCTKTPLNKMQNMDLPPNLHIQYEYHRWHPDTDKAFGGITAFPESSTLVTGLKYRNKYKGHRQNITVPRE